MPFNTTSSTIGVDLNNTSTTQLFALGTKVFGTNNTEWMYVQSTAAFITGEMVAVRTGGTAVSCSTLILTSGAAGGYEIGWAQGNFAAADYGWLARRGDSISVLMSGTAVPNTQLYLAYGNSIGALSTTAGSATMLGIQLNASSSTASLVLTTAVITWPRCVAQLS